jgi:glycosyltransferase involved in cell wall biosynthesis
MGGGGSELQLAYLAEAQRKEGEDVHVALTAGGPHLDRLRDAGVATHALSGWGPHDPRLLWRLVALARRLQPDILQTWLRQMDVLGAMAARWAQVPWLLSERASQVAYSPMLKHALRVRLAVSASGIVSNSPSGDAYWARRLDARVPRWIIPNAVPLAEIEAAAPIPTESIGLPAGHLMVLYVGRLSPEKNVESLVQAIAILPKLLPLTVFLCGTGPSEASLRRLVERLELKEIVRFAGFVPSIWPWMRRADAQVLVSPGEGQPNAVLEAMAAGCPLVLSDMPTHRELAGDDGAILVDPGSPAEIASGIVRCLREPEAARKRARRARTSLSGRSPGEVARKYREVYRDILSRDRESSACAESSASH